MLGHPSTDSTPREGALIPITMDTSEQEYLQPGFNPAKYKVAQLRNVLMQNDISYPSGAKKQDLINLFNKHVKPTAAQKLKLLNSVVANHDRIEIVPKKTRAKALDISTDEDSDSKKKRSRKTSRNTTAEGTSTEPDVTTVRKSPVKMTRSKVTEGKSNLGSAPALKPTRIQTARKSSNVKKSPLKKAPVKQESSSSESSESSDDSDDSAFEMLTEEEFKQSASEKKSPFKLGASKIESSFSNDNVFQSPIPSSPELKTKKTIPRKRAAETTSKSPKKAMKPMRKTAFSSSPEQQHPKSPLKKSLAMSKFETSSPSFSKNGKDLFEPDLSFGDSRLFKEAHPRKTEQVNEPFTEPSVEEPIAGKTPKLNADEAFMTPHDGNASHVSIGSSPQYQTPSKSVKRKSLIPDFSKFKVSSGFAKTLSSKLPSFASGPDTSIHTETELPKDEDPELLSDEESDEEEKGSIVVQSNDDSCLLNLQNEIESANETVLKETEGAIKQVNDIFDSERGEIEVGEERSPAKTRVSLFNWPSVLGFINQLTIFLLFVVATVFAIWYREQRVMVGYCGSEIYQPTFPSVDNEYIHQFEDFLDTVKPNCLPCPDNAICLPAMRIRCKQDFIATQPWYKLYGLLPFRDYCVKDQEKENIINEVVSKSLDLLRTRNAEIKCGDGDDLEVGISDDELYQFFYSSKNPSVSDDEFNEIWEKVLKDLEKEPEITLQYADVDSPGSSFDDVSTNEDEEEETNIPHQRRKTIFRSTSHVKLTVSCKFKKEIYERVDAHKHIISAFGSILFFVIVLYFKYVRYQERQSKIREISDIIVTKLQKQQMNSIKDTTGLTNRFLSAIQLRDELLSTMVNNKKFQLWDSILGQLERNSNIRSSTKEIHGEIVRVLEWIGE